MKTKEEKAEKRKASVKKWVEANPEKRKAIDRATHAKACLLYTSPSPRD